MKTFRTSSGYVFKVYQRGDICKIARSDYLPVGALVKVLSMVSELSRDVMVLNLSNNKNVQVNCQDLELVKQSTDIAEDILS